MSVNSLQSPAGRAPTFRIHVGARPAGDIPNPQRYRGTTPALQPTTRKLAVASLLILQLSFNSPVSAAERQYLKKNETFCDSSGVLCLNGSLTYWVNSRIVSLNARVQKQTGPGVIKIILTGSNRQDFFRRTEIEIAIRGKHSEIINYQMGPDAPDVYEWSLSSFEFMADDSK